MRSLGSGYIHAQALALLASMAIAAHAQGASVPDSVLKAAPASILEAKPNDHKVSETRIKSYREWKSERVQAAISKVTQTRTQLQISKSKDPNLAIHKGSTEAASGSSIEKLEAQLQMDQHVLETAKNFSVTDYLAGYLMKIQNKKAAFNEVAAKLTAEEIAELMSAYANSAFGSPMMDLSPSANSSSEDRVR